MKVSQLVGALLAILAEHGDLDVTAWRWDVSDYLDIDPPEVADVGYNSRKKEVRINA